MVATHPGMKDQTDSNIARSGAAKRPQTSFPTTHGMRSRIGEVAGVKGDGSGPDASSPNPLDPTTKGKSTPTPSQAWGMEKSPTTHSPQLGSKVLSEAANLGR